MEISELQGTTMTPYPQEDRYPKSEKEKKTSNICPQQHHYLGWQKRQCLASQVWDKTVTRGTNVKLMFYMWLAGSYQKLATGIQPLQNL